MIPPPSPFLNMRNDVYVYVGPESVFLTPILIILDMGFVIEYKLLPQHLYLNWKILLEISLIDQLEKNKKAKFTTNQLEKKYLTFMVKFSKCEIFLYH